MSMYINSNTAALNAYQNLQTTNNQMSTSLARLSSGFRINKAADDAAGLAISDGLESQVQGLTQGVQNAQTGINVVQTADGALATTTNILQRMRTLTVQALNTGSNDSSSNSDMQTEITQLQNELNSIVSSTTFNNVNLLNGTFTSASKQFQVGASSSDVIKFDIALSGGGGFSAAGLGVSSVDLTAVSSAMLTDIDNAIKSVDTARANLGAVQNRLQNSIDNSNTAITNLSASEASIKDTDMAAEMTNYSREQILQQAGTAMLSQANSQPQSILKLLNA